MKLFAGTPGVFRTSFNATDADLIFARVRVRHRVDDFSTHHDPLSPRSRQHTKPLLDAFFHYSQNDDCQLPI